MLNYLPIFSNILISHQIQNKITKLAIKQFNTKWFNIEETFNFLIESLILYIDNKLVQNKTI